MADNKSGIHHGGGYRHGPQDGMTFDPKLTILRYTDPDAAVEREAARRHLRQLKQAEKALRRPHGTSGK